MFIVLWHDGEVLALFLIHGIFFSWFPNLNMRVGPRNSRYWFFCIFQDSGWIKFHGGGGSKFRPFIHIVATSLFYFTQRANFTLSFAKTILWIFLCFSESPHYFVRSRRSASLVFVRPYLKLANNFFTVCFHRAEPE